MKHLFFLSSALCIIALACNPPQPITEESWPPVAAPEAVGMSADTLVLIEQLLQQAIDSQKIAGGVALIARNDQVIYYQSVGFSDRAKSDTLQKTDIFRIASMTKPITTVAIMQLVEQGKLNVTDPVSKFIPEFAGAQVVENFSESDSSYTLRPANTEMTIHHLLTHTSGLAYGVFMPKAGAIYAPFNPIQGWSIDSVFLADNAKVIGRLPLLHDPGTEWTYGISTDVLGRVVEVVGGLPLDVYFQKNIFEPLGMNDTHFFLPEEKASRLVQVWYRSGTVEESTLGFADYPVTGAKTYFSGGAGLSSTVADYYRFASALLNGGEWQGQRILKPETVALMASNQIEELSLSPGEQFGYGFAVQTEDGRLGRKKGRYSWGGYWQTTFWVDPSRDLVAILFTNVLPSGIEGALFDRYELLINNAVQ